MTTRTDLAIRLDTHDSGTIVGDLLFNGFDLETDEGLRSAVIVSLFTDRRAETDDVLPIGETDRRGWVGDLLQPDRSLWLGSRLWLRFPGKQLPSVLAQVEQDAREALAWLETDRVAQIVSVTSSIPRPETLGLDVALRRVGGPLVRYHFVWRQV